AIAPKTRELSHRATKHRGLHEAAAPSLNLARKGIEACAPRGHLHRRRERHSRFQSDQLPSPQYRLRDASANSGAVFPTSLPPCSAPPQCLLAPHTEKL